MNLDMNIFSGLIDVCCMMEQGEFPHVPDFPRDALIKKALRGKQLASKGAAYRYQALAQRRGGEPRKKVIRSLMLSLKWIEISGFQMEAAYTKIELIREYLSLGHSDKAAGIMKGLLPSFNSYGEYLIPDDLKYLYKELNDEKSL